MRQIAILGSTGSIGTQTLSVVRDNRKDFEVAALTAGSNVERLAEQILEFQPACAVMKDEEHAERLRREVMRRIESAASAGNLSPALEKSRECQILSGMEGFIRAATLSGVDTVVAAMVGMIGLRPVMEAIRAGKNIALANKETLVTAGHLIMPLAEKHNVSILPVDSEHSAIFQALHGEKKSQIETIYLTASGGPFRGSTREQLERVTVEQALAHPNWSMGEKITIDSATMINKGLEVIEARWLCGTSLEQIHVLVQPQSVIHSMVGFRDGAVMAQLGTPDMRLPIQYALYYPDRVFLDGERLDFEAIGDIHFEKPDTELLRGIPLAVEASRTGGSMPVVMNVANEYAVAKFLKRDISFLEIYDMIEFAMKHHKVIKNPELDEILSAERETRERLDRDWRKS